MSRALWAACVVGLALASVGALEPASSSTSLDEALGEPVSGAAAVDLEHRREQAVEELTGACMARLGLPYTPFLDAPAPIPDADLDPIAWASRWGFGIATSVGVAIPASGPDPNVERVAAMAADLRGRYMDALIGGGGGPGCRVTANDAVRGLRDRLLAPLDGALRGMRAAVAADERTGRFLTAWRACLASNGIDGTDRSMVIPKLVGSIAERLRLASGRTPAADLRPLQDEERRLATAIARCEAAYVEAATAVTREYEGRFVAEHRAVLEAIRHALAAADAALPTWPP